jgi:two-component system sensor histidine kinase/response regulator
MIEQNKILVVDDNVTNLTIVEETLSDDYEIVCASSGAEALAVASKFRPDLVLLDIMMPEMDGYETCRRLRADPQLRYVKVVLVSAKTRTADRLLGYEAGADDYITKPFVPEELAAKVRVFLRLKSVEELDQMKTEILTLLAHETRTPLTCVAGVLDMLRSPVSLPEHQREEALDIARQNCTRLQTLIEKSNMLWRLRAGQVAAKIVPTDASTIVSMSVGGVTAFANDRQVRIRVDVPASVSVRGDAELLTLVLQSLLHNAIRFSPSPGVVRAEVTQENRFVTFAVIDKGPGIDPSRVSGLFDAFETNDIMHHTQGQGLSLAVAHEIVKRHGGLVELAPGETGETRFVVRIPSATTVEKTPVA